MYSCQCAFAFYIIWKFDSEKEKKMCKAPSLKFVTGSNNELLICPKHRMQFPSLTFSLCICCPVCQKSSNFLLFFLCCNSAFDLINN